MTRGLRAITQRLSREAAVASVLVFSFSLTGCTRHDDAPAAAPPSPPTTSAPITAEAAIAVCPGEDPTPAAVIADDLMRLGATDSAAGGQDLAIALGLRFEKSPCTFFAQARAAGLIDERIADLLKSLPSEFVDRHCDRAARLRHRGETLARLPPSLDAEGIGSALAESREQYAKHCEAAPKPIELCNLDLAAAARAGSTHRIRGRFLADFRHGSAIGGTECPDHGGPVEDFPPSLAPAFHEQAFGGAAGRRFDIDATVQVLPGDGSDPRARIRIEHVHDFVVAPPGLDLSATPYGDGMLDFRLRNETTRAFVHAETIFDDTPLPDGGLWLVFRYDGHFQLPCARLDQVPSGRRVLETGKTLGFVANADQLSRLYCLVPGRRYDLVIAVLERDGDGFRIEMTSNATPFVAIPGPSGSPASAWAANEDGRIVRRNAAQKP